MIHNIVIEGPNNVGKSTFISKLLDRKEFHDWCVEHLTEQSPNNFEFYDATLQNCHDTIFDRHCIGETIYPTLFNRTPNINATDVIDLVKNHNDTLFIILSADFTFISKAYDAKCETPDWNFITKERQQFESAAKVLMKNNKNVHFFINEYEFETMNDLVDFIVKLYQEEMR